MKAIIFDCFGVLTTDIWRSFLDNLPEGADRLQASALNRALDKGIISFEEFKNGVQQATGQVPPDLEAMSGAGTTKNQALLDLIRVLKTDYKIGLMSNISSDWITSEFLTEEEQALFNTMVLSYELGMVKPDPRMYILACERLRVAPHEALMVDDNMQYVEGAREAGLSGIQYEDLRSFKQQLNELLATNY